MLLGNFCCRCCNSTVQLMCFVILLMVEFAIATYTALKISQLSFARSYLMDYISMYSSYPYSSYYLAYYHCKSRFIFRTSQLDKWDVFQRNSWSCCVFLFQISSPISRPLFCHWGCQESGCWGHWSYRSEKCMCRQPEHLICIKYSTFTRIKNLISSHLFTNLSW